MRSRKSLLLTATAIAALGFSSTGALAFDEVDWEWNKTVDELVIKRVNINADLVPSGVVELEKLQIFIGDVSATSIVSDIQNNPPDGGGGGTGIITIDGSLLVDGHGEPGASGQPIDTLVVIPGGDPDGDPASFDDEITPTLNVTGGTIVSGPQNLESGGLINEGTDDFELTTTFDGLVIQVDPTDGVPPLDAVDLPSVESVATAVGNNQQITTDTSVQLHDAQVVFNTCFDCQGGFDGPGLELLLDFASSDNGTDDIDAGEVQVDGGDNLHTDIALLGSLAAVLGVISPSQITADSQVFNINQATVDSSATAVANNIGVEVAALEAGDGLVIGDITQFAYADVSASSMVNNVNISNYANLGVLDGPIVSSVATAVGNNVNVNVSRNVVVEP